MAFYTRSAYSLPLVTGDVHEVDNKSELAAAFAAANGRNDRIELTDSFSDNMPSFGSGAATQQLVGLSGQSPTARLVIAAQSEHGATIVDGGAGFGFWPSNCNYLHFYGLEVDTNGAWGVVVGKVHGANAAYVRGPCSYVTFERIKISGTGGEGGFVVSNASSFIDVIDCDIDSGGEGIYLGTGADDLDTSSDILLRGNVIRPGQSAGHNGGAEAIDIKPRVTRVTVEHNLIDCSTIVSASHSGAITLCLSTNPNRMQGLHINHVVRWNRIMDAPGTQAGIQVNVEGVSVYGNVIVRCGYGIVVTSHRTGELGGASKIYFNTLYDNGADFYFNVGYSNGYGNDTVAVDVQGNVYDTKLGDPGTGSVASTFANNYDLSAGAGTAVFIGPLDGDMDAGDGPLSGLRPAGTALDGGPDLSLVYGQDLFGVARPAGALTFGAFQAGTASATAPTAGFTLSPGTAIPGETVTLTNTTTGTEPIDYLIQWGDGAVDATDSDDPDATHSYQSAGTYVVQLDATNTVGSDTAFGTVVVQGATVDIAMVGVGGNPLSTKISAAGMESMSVGDFVVFSAVGPGPDDGGGGTATVPDGWTVLHEDSGTGDDPHVLWAYKFVTGDDIGVEQEFVLAHSSTADLAYYYMVFVGVDPDNPIDAAATAVTRDNLSGSDTADGPAITTLTDGAWGLTWMMSNETSPTATVDWGGTIVPGGTHWTSVGLRVAPRVIDTAGPAGTPTWTSTAGTADCAFYTFALRPVSTSGGTAVPPDPVEPPEVLLAGNGTAIPIPQNLDVGDYMVAFVSGPPFARNGTATTGLPDDWTLIDEKVGGTANPWSSRLVAAGKFWTPADGGGTAVFDVSGDLEVARNWNLRVYKGVNALQPIDAVGTAVSGYSGQGADVEGPVVSSVTNGAWAVTGFVSGGLADYDTPSGWNNVADSGSGWERVRSADKPLPSAGSSGTPVWEADPVSPYDNNWTAVTFALRPTAGTAVTAEPPEAAFTLSPGTALIGEVFTATSTSTGDIESYLWQWGDDSTSLGTVATHAYSAAGTYTVTHIVEGPGGAGTATGTAIVAAPVTPAPPAGEPISTDIVTVEIAPSDGWNDTSPSWVDLSGGDPVIGDRVTSVRIDRQVGGVGRATIVLLNDDGMFDPDESGAVKPVPNAQLRVTATVDGQTYPLFRGHIPPREGWQFTDSTHTSRVTVTAYDLANVLAREDIEPMDQGSWRGDLVSVRIKRLLDAAGVPTSWRAVDRGQVIAAPTAGGFNTQRHLDELAEAEGGVWFVDRNGVFVFHDRHAPWVKTRTTTSQATLESPGTAGFSGLTRGWGMLVNRVTVESGDGWRARASNSSSIAANGPATTPNSPMRLASEGIVDATALARFLVQLYGVQVLGPETVQIHPRVNEELLEQALLRDLRDRVTVKYTPAGVESQRTKSVLIDGISHQIGPQNWVTTWRLMDADRFDTAYDADDWLRLDGTDRLDGTKKLAP